MTIPTVSPARKRLRLASLFAALALGMSGTALVAGAGTASASSLCNNFIYSNINWGGTYYCDSPQEYRMPNGGISIFVIGKDNAVWTRWDSGSLSSWVSLGGKCLDTGPLGVGNWNSDGWDWYVECTGTDNNPWYNQRVDEGNGAGSWQGWHNYINGNL